jgi:hypothetical protein
MPLPYLDNGRLEPGEHQISWEEFVEYFAYNELRKKLLSGIEKAIHQLKAVGCTTIFVDGSFVTKEPAPGDFDLCWDEEGVDFKKLTEEFRELRDFGYRMKTMKSNYGGTIVPMTNIADMDMGTPFLWYFQMEDGWQKGIIKLSIV